MCPITIIQEAECKNNIFFERQEFQLVVFFVYMKKKFKTRLDFQPIKMDSILIGKLLRKLFKKVLQYS